MTILFDDRQYDNEKQALLEFAFCHYPLTVTINGEDLTFDEFSVLEKYIKDRI